MHKVSLRLKPDPGVGLELIAAWRVEAVEPEPGGGWLLTLDVDVEGPDGEPLAVFGVPGGPPEDAVVWWRDQTWSSPVAEEMRLLVTGRDPRLMGFKGNSYMDAGYFYAPYVPGPKAPTVLDPDSYSPGKGVLTRYGKKLIEQGKAYYATITIGDVGK